MVLRQISVDKIRSLTKKEFEYANSLMWLFHTCLECEVDRAQTRRLFCPRKVEYISFYSHKLGERMLRQNML